MNKISSNFPNTERLIFKPLLIGFIRLHLNKKDMVGYSTSKTMQPVHKLTYQRQLEPRKTVFKVAFVRDDKTSGRLHKRQKFAATANKGDLMTTRSLHKPLFVSCEV